MNRSTLVLAAVLAASLAANVYFVVTRRSSARPAATTATAAPGSTPPAPAPAPAAPALPPPVRTGGSAVPANGFAPTCPGELTALQQRLDAAERKVEERLSLSEKFERAGHTPDAERALEPFLAKVFEGAPDTLGRDVECHGEVCKLEIVAPEGGVDFDWQQRLQSHEERRTLLAGMSFHAPKPGQDPVSKEPVMTAEVYMGLAGDEAHSGLDVLGALVDGFLGSSQLAACKASHPAPGHLSLRLDLDAVAKTIAITAGGTLAITAGGSCMVGALQPMADQAAAAMPAGTLGAVRFVTITVP